MIGYGSNYTDHPHVQGERPSTVDWERCTVNVVGLPWQFRGWLLRTTMFTSVGFIDISRVKVLP